MTVTVERSYHRRPSVLAGGYGSMQTLPNGHVVVGWGNLPLATEFAADGTMIAEVDLPVAYASYRAYRQPWSATPGARPTVAVTRRGRGHGARVSASWNGSTECSAWRVRVGADPSRLHGAGTHRRTGLQTAFDVPVSHGYVQVTALDRAGRALAHSHPVKV
jgi:hypothetical protein